MPFVKFKIYHYSYDIGLADYAWQEFKYADGSVRDFKFTDISSSLENPEMPAHFWAEPSGVVIADDDNFFGNLVSADKGLLNTSDPIWQDWHYRPVKIEILDADDTVLYSVVSAIDDIIPQEKSPWAKINLMSLGRRSADMAADGERAWGTSSGSPIPLFGAYGDETDPTLYLDRTKDLLTGTISKDWYRHKNAFSIMRKTCAALQDDVIAEPDITPWDIDTADGRRIIASHHTPEDFISDTEYTALCFVLYDGVEYLFLGAKTKLYMITLSTLLYQLLETETNGYYFQHIFYNDNPGVNMLYAIATEIVGTGPGQQYGTASVYQYDLEQADGTWQTITGLYEPDGDSWLQYVVLGNMQGFGKGLFAFKKDGGTDGKGALYFQSYKYPSTLSARANSTAYSVGDYVRASIVLMGEDASMNWFFLECIDAGTSGASFPVISVPVNEGYEFQDGNCTWRLHYQVFVEARNLFDIGGASWNTDLGIVHTPVMYSVANAGHHCIETIFYTYGIHYAGDYLLLVAGGGFCGYSDEYVYYAGQNIIIMNIVSGVCANLHEAAADHYITEVCYANSKVIFNEFAVWNGNASQYLKSMTDAGGSLTTLHSNSGLTMFYCGLVAAPDGRCYCFMNSSNMLLSTDGSTARIENWLYTPDSGDGHGVPAFEMASNSIWNGTIDDLPAILVNTSAVPLVLDDQSTDWRLFGIAQPDSQHFFIYSKKDYGYIDFCEWEGKSIADLRDYCAKRLGGVWFYDKTGKFCFQKRIPDTASVYDFAEGEATVQLKNSGRDKIKNRYVYIPSQIAATPCEITNVSLEKALTSVLEIDPGGIKISSGCDESALWKVSFENSGDLTQYKLYKWDTVNAEYDYVATGDRDSIFQSGYITISPDAFTGTATVYDNFAFFTTPMKYAYTQLTYVDRTEVEDADSIDLYGIREHEVNETYIKRIHSLDTLTAWLNMTKDPHPVYSIRYPAALATLNIGVVITLTSAKFGLTSAKKQKVVLIKPSATLGTAMIDAEVADINIS